MSRFATAVAAVLIEIAEIQWVNSFRPPIRGLRQRSIWSMGRCLGNLRNGNVRTERKSRTRREPYESESILRFCAQRALLKSVPTHCGARRCESDVRKRLTMRVTSGVMLSSSPRCNVLSTLFRFLNTRRECVMRQLITQGASQRTINNCIRSRRAALHRARARRPICRYVQLSRLEIVFCFQRFC